jgi:taurine--2-oxoglutarate transaminase
MNHWNVTPDILVTAKGITSAYMPLGLCATNSKIAAHFDDHLFAHGHTYESHPMTLAPAVATIHEMQRLGLVERSREMGEYLGSKLRELKKKHVSIGDVRGMGLFWGVELVKNQKTKEPINTKREKIESKPLVVDKVAGAMMKEGVSVISWISHFVIGPPLIIEKSEIDFAIQVMDRALEIADREVMSVEQVVEV